jgi:hypothetical protein
MPATYEKIATNTLGSAASSITFSSIPATYTDLKIVLTATYSATTSSGGQLSFNGAPSGTLSSYTRLYGQGTSPSTAINSNQPAITPADTAWTLGNTMPDFYTYDIFSYAGSTFKTVLTTNSQDYNGSGSTGIKVGLWRSTTAITSCVLTASVNFATGTTATLYGILKA